MTGKLTRGAHHIGLTVPDVGAARDFFAQALGFEVVGGVPDYPSIFVSDGAIMLTLWQAGNPVTATPFDRRANIGLHHLALAVVNDEALAQAYERIGAYPGATIEFAPKPMRPGSRTRHFIFAMPGGVRIELATLS
jgi:catechol 2,3-dioxygenase-like lactoylglutathione lyase family enzyme